MTYTVELQPSSFGVAARVVCDECSEHFDLVLMEDQIDAIARTSAANASATVLLEALRLHQRELAVASAVCIDLAVWILTHTTGHAELARRERAKGSTHVH